MLSTFRHHSQAFHHRLRDKKKWVLFKVSMGRAKPPIEQRSADTRQEASFYLDGATDGASLRTPSSSYMQIQYKEVDRSQTHKQDRETDRQRETVKQRETDRETENHTNRHRHRYSQRTSYHPENLIWKAIRSSKNLRIHS